ncbi:MAG: hypothetical protein H6825_10670 [Planctomycetes bacterium]|nr:hypothetical protein [Planctomycetota bacterium]
MASRPGFAAFVRDGRLWVFRAGSPELSEFHAQGEPSEQFTRPGAGFGGMTLKGPDRETVEAYLAAS